MLLEDKVTIVTASTRGIGHAIVSLLSQNGAKVYMAARNKNLAMEKIDEFKSKGLDVKFVYNDASKPETFKTMIDEVVKNEGKIDVLVNNFGTSNPKIDLDIDNTKVDDFISFVDINLKSVFISSQEAIKHMRKNKSGSIINISSIGGLIPDISQISYGTAKAAINHLSKIIAVQAARDNIRCNVVAPGMTATDAVNTNLSENFKDVFMKNSPIERMATPEEIAQAVLYFASDASKFTTGQIISVSGGFGLASPIFGDFSQMKDKR